MATSIDPTDPIHFAHRLLRARDWQHRPQLDDLCDWWRTGGQGVCALVGMGGAVRAPAPNHARTLVYLAYIICLPIMTVCHAGCRRAAPQASSPPPIAARGSEFLSAVRFLDLPQLCAGGPDRIRYVSQLAIGPDRTPTVAVGDGSDLHLVDVATRRVLSSIPLDLGERRCWWTLKEKVHST